MVYNFDLISDLRVNYNAPLQKLNIETVQDSGSVIHKSEEHKSLEIKKKSIV